MVDYFTINFAKGLWENYRNVKPETFRNPRFTEFQTENSQTWLGVALGIPQNTEYFQKALSEGALTRRNVLDCTYSLAND
jgi:hypothetical protein